MLTVNLPSSPTLIVLSSTSTSKVMLLLSLRAIVPLPFTKPTSLLSLLIVSTV
ncbi:hypothetical protein COI_2049 [Mannheimia haemolytica serotype A2 str. OVINE]|nr:hypothetical protein COI_2049 [Mannheimia haemolytica serotype A2 str. OVINE]EEY13381.1 hypothetical protein COK_0522 [Mannheimia haemolytica serotype A2 str. BOVINE]